MAREQKRIFQDRRRRRAFFPTFPYARRESDAEKSPVEKWVELVDSALKKKKPPQQAR